MYCRNFAHTVKIVSPGPFFAINSQIWVVCTLNLLPYNCIEADFSVVSVDKKATPVLDEGQGWSRIVEFAFL